MRNKQGRQVLLQVPSEDLSSEKKKDQWSRNRATRRSQLQFHFRKDRFPPREVVFINLAYRANEFPHLPSEYQGSCWDFAGTKPPAGRRKHLFARRTVSGAAIIRAILRASPRTRCEYCSSILPPLICQITLALEKGMLVSDLGVNGRSRAHGVRVSRKTTRLN